MVGLASPLAKPLARGLALTLTDPEGGGVPGWTYNSGFYPQMAAEFANSRYYGLTIEDVLSCVRASGADALNSSGGTVSFAANTPRITDMGLYYDTAETGTDIVGRLLAAIQGTAGTLVADINEVTGNFTTILGGDGSVQFLSRGASASVIGAYNGTQSLTIATASSMQTGPQTLALAFDGTGRMLKSRASSSGVASDANGIGSRSRVRVGRNNSGPGGTGFIRALYWYATKLAEADIATLIANPPSVRKFVAWGDSMPAGSGASTAAARAINQLAAAYNPDATLLNQGNGGDTSSAVVTRFNNDTAAAVNRAWMNIFWCGHNSPNAAQTVADLQTMVGQLRGARDYIIIQPVQNTSNGVGTADYNAILATRTAISAAFPAARIFDAPAALAAADPLDPNVANGYTPSTLLSDTIHLNDAGQDVIDTGLQGMVASLGYK